MHFRFRLGVWGNFLTSYVAFLAALSTTSIYAQDQTVNGKLSVTGTTASTSSTTGALTVAGGLGVAGAGNFGGVLSAAGSLGIGTATPSTATALDIQKESGVLRLKNLTTAVTNSLDAAGTQAKRFEIARLTIDYNDWNNTGPLEIDLYENRWGLGLKKKYYVYYGYISDSGAYLAEVGGGLATYANNFRVSIGSEVAITGDYRYMPVYVDVRNHSQVTAVVRTNHKLSGSNPPEVGHMWFNPAPTGEDIVDFTPDTNVFANNVTGFSTIFNQGNVGIGTANPQAKLHVVGSMITENTLPLFRLNNNKTAVSQGDALGTIEFYTNDASTNTTGSAASVIATATGSYTANQGGASLDFLTRPTGEAQANSILRARITHAGNLLIGGTSDLGDIGGGLKVFSTIPSTTTTSGALQVAGGVGVAGASYFGNNLTVAGSLTVAGTFSAPSYTSSSGSVTGGTSGLNLSAGGTGNQNVTLTPTGTGSAVVDGRTLTLKNDNGTSNGLLSQILVNREAYDPAGNAAAIQFYRGGNTSEGSIAFSTNPGPATGQQPVERMRITEYGDVGIGTVNPTHKLTVNGTIRAKEVLVDNSILPDYVFADNYRNAPLSEVEAHIKEHRHLPGVPSAKEVAARGMNVVNMQNALLAKIEELTLHLIAQEKMMSEQRAEVAALRTRLAQFEERSAAK